jgi:hypothetical protein
MFRHQSRFLQAQVYRIAIEERALSTRRKERGIKKAISTGACLEQAKVSPFSVTTRYLFKVREVGEMPQY